VFGRPVEIALGADGAVYVSDDYGGVVYRIAAGETRTPRAAAGEAARPAPAGGSDPLAAIPPAERAAARERGGAIYEANACYTCHEPERAAPGVVPKPLRNLRARYDVDGLAAFFVAPTPPMPAFPLSESQRRDLAIFLLDRG
jgi:cytochrome c5